MEINPINKFKELFRTQITQSQAIIPRSCCLSTNGIDGYPNARFLELKDVNDEGFVVAGSLSGRKGKEIENNPKVFLVFWWPTTGIQVRIQGDAKISFSELSDKYFSERSREAKLTSLISKQGRVIDDPEILYDQLKKEMKEFEGREIPRPDDWACILIVPIRIEFLRFNKSSLHKRTLYTKIDEGWKKEYLQP